MYNIFLKYIPANREYMCTNYCELSMCNDLKLWDIFTELGKHIYIYIYIYIYISILIKLRHDTKL